MSANVMKCHHIFVGHIVVLDLGVLVEDSLDSPLQSRTLSTSLPLVGSAVRAFLVFACHP